MFRSAKLLLFLLLSGAAFAQTTVQGGVNGIPVPLTLPLATMGTYGLAQCDGTTTTCLGGVISAAGGTGVTPASVTGVRYSAGSATTDTAATSSQLAAALNASPVTKLVNALFPTTLTSNTSGTAANLSGTPALPNGTSATTQTAGDNTTNLATDAFANAAASASNATLLAAANTWTNSNTYTNRVISTYAQAVSASAFSWTGVPVSGGTSTTTFPIAYLNCSGSTAPTTFTTVPAYFGANACNASTSPFLDYYLNGVNKFRVGSDGSITASGQISGATLIGNALQFGNPCNDSSNPAICASASDGVGALAAGSQTTVINDSRVQANSKIFVIFDQSLTVTGVTTCNTSSQNLFISARVVGTSFTIKSSAAPTTNPACFSWFLLPQ